jgi:predicted glycosyltransferase involved in capsule biosynthesis
MSIPKDMVKKVNHYTGEYSAWFPQIWFTHRDGTGHFMSEGTGIMASQRQQFLNFGGYDESIIDWGKEDWFLFFEYYKNGVGCIRSKEPEFIHHYHESLKPEGYENLF